MCDEQNRLGCSGSIHHHYTRRVLRVKKKTFIVLTWADLGLLRDNGQTTRLWVCFFLSSLFEDFLSPLWPSICIPSFLSLCRSLSLSPYEFCQHPVGKSWFPFSDAGINHLWNHLWINRFLRFSVQSSFLIKSALVQIIPKLLDCHWQFAVWLSRDPFVI